MVGCGGAWATHALGLSMALGGFLAGMLLAETEFRHQTEAVIKPFQDILLGLFFVFFWLAIIRRLWWGWGGGWGPRGWYGYRHRYYRDVPPEFEEWHRRAHAEQQPPPKS